MTQKLVVCALLSASFCWADAPLVKHLLESALADSESAPLATTDPAYLPFVNAVEALTPVELEMLLPTAIQCMKSPHLRAQFAGDALLLAAVQTPASAALFDPYIGDFDAMLSDTASPNRRQGLIATLIYSRPRMSPKAIQLFVKHLQDKANTPLQTGWIAAGLLRAAPSNEALVRHVLSYAETRSEYDVRSAVLQQIGLSMIQLPEALDYLAKELDDPAVRSNAITAVAYMGSDVRARFALQLSRIANDPGEKADIRAAAAAAINGR